MSEHVIHITEARPWMPQVIQRAIEVGRKVIYEAEFSKAERRVLRKRRKLPISQWAERHRWVRISSREGQWQNSTTPYLAGIMDAVGEPYVLDVTVCAAPQTGKTEMGYNCLASWIDQDPGPAMVVFADEQTARDELNERIEPMINDSPRLNRYKTQAARDMSSLRLALQHMVIHMAWASSVARLATKPKRYVLFDETDKYPEHHKRETDPISLGIKRTRTYPDDKKIIKISSPTWEAGAIWQSLQAAQATFRYHVRCPGCGHMQDMVFGDKGTSGGIKWPEDERDPATIETLRLAWYQCAECGAHWDDARRDQAVLLGEWRCRETGRELRAELQTSRPTRIGFHIPAWLSTFVSLSECAGAFLRGQTDKVKLRDFQNAYAAEPWKTFEIPRKEDQILALRDERPRGEVPGGGVVSCLTAGVDTQDNGLWYEIRAWGYGPDLESWQIRQGFIEKLSYDQEGRPANDLETLARILWEERYWDPDGNPYMPILTLQDAMGHRTAEVYEFCRHHPGRILPSQGHNRQGGPPVSYSNIRYYPGTKKPIPGGLRLAQINTTFFKNTLAGKLEIDPGDPGAWHYHRDTTEDWAQQMCSEAINEKGLWEQIASRANHAWDCSVLNLVAAWILDVSLLRPGSEAPSGQKTSRRPRDSWVRRESSGWMNR